MQNLYWMGFIYQSVQPPPPPHFVSMKLQFTLLVALICAAVAQSDSKSSDSGNSSGSGSSGGSGGSGSSTGSPSQSQPPPSSSELSPQTKTTNKYFTPEKTFSVTHKTEPFPGKTTAISGVGPSVSTNSYTFTYNQPDKTQSITQNPSLSSALVNSGIDIRSSASNLEPDPTHLQDARNYGGVVRAPILVAIAAVTAAGAILL